MVWDIGKKDAVAVWIKRDTGCNAFDNAGGTEPGYEGGARERIKRSATFGGVCGVDEGKRWKRKRQRHEFAAQRG